MALLKESKEKLIKDFRINEQDTGSAQVQVALLTENIRLLTAHCQKYPKDISSKRGLLKMVCQRRRFLNYLLKNDEAQYKKIVSDLGLKK